MEKCIITDQVDDDLESALKQIRDKGIHCVELHNVHGKSIEACSDEEIEQIKRLLDAYGMKVSSIASTIFFLCPLYESDQVSLFNPAFYTIEGDADAHLAYAGRACRIAKNWEPVSCVRFRSGRRTIGRVRSEHRPIMKRSWRI